MQNKPNSKLDEQELELKGTELLAKMAPIEKALDLLWHEYWDVDYHRKYLHARKSTGKIYRWKTQGEILYDLPYERENSMRALCIAIETRGDKDFRVRDETRYCGPMSEMTEVDRNILLKDLEQYSPALLTLLGPERNAIATQLKPLIEELSKIITSEHLSEVGNSLLKLNIQRARQALYLTLSLEGDPRKQD